MDSRPSLGFTNNKYNDSIKWLYVTDKLNLTNSTIDFKDSSIINFTAPLYSLPDPIQSIANTTYANNLTPDKLLYTVGVNHYDMSSITAQARTFLAESTITNQQNILNLSPGSDIQVYSPGLQSIATNSATIGSDKLLYSISNNTFTTSALTPYARSILSSIDAATTRSILGTFTKTPSSTVNTIPLWNVTSGDELKESPLTVNPSTGDISGIGDLTLTGNISPGITPSIRTQLSNIQTETITNSSWNYLSNLNQNLSTTSQPTFSGGLLMNGSRIQNVGDPIIGTDVANKAYIDSLSLGITPREAVRASTITILPNTPVYSDASQTLTSALGVTLSIDGVALNLGDRVLVKNQVVLRENGIYTLTMSSPWVLTRASDFNLASLPLTSGQYYYTSEGAINAGKAFYLVSAVADFNIGTSITFNLFNSTVSVTAGTGLTLTGTTMNVNTGGNGLGVDGFNRLELSVPVTIANGGTNRVSLTSGNVLIGNGTNPILDTKVAPSGDFIGTTDIQTLTNKDITDPTNTVRASQLGGVSITSAGTPSNGQVLVATSGTTAIWKNFTSSITKTISVSPSGGDYATIGAAITAATLLTPTQTSQVIILVHPGYYIENNPLTIPSYVTITQVNGPSGSTSATLVTAANPLLPIFIMDSVTVMGGLTMFGAAIGIQIPSGKNTISIGFCNISNCTIGIDVTDSSCALFANVLAAPMQTALNVTGATSNVIYNIQAIRGNIATLDKVNKGINCTTGSKIFGFGMQFFYCATGVYLDNATDFKMTSGSFSMCDTGIYIGVNSVATITGVLFNTNTNYDAYLSSPTSYFETHGNKIEDDKIENSIMGTILGSGSSISPGHERVVNFSNVSVGTITAPRKIVVGQGGNTIFGMRAFRTPSNTEITNELKYHTDSNAVPIFDSTTVNDALYLGLPHQFKGFESHVNTGVVSGEYTKLTVEYYNSLTTTWTEVKHMTSDDSYPYANYANYILRTGEITVRFGSMPNWGQTTVNGVSNYYWIRIRISSTGLTTIPVCEQFRLITNHTEITKDGFIKHYGDSQVYEKSLTIQTGDGSNTKSYIAYLDQSCNISFTTRAYKKNNTGSFGFIFDLPSDINTAYPIEFRVRYNSLVSLSLPVVSTITICHFDTTTQFYATSGTAPVTSANRLVSFNQNITTNSGELVFNIDVSTLLNSKDSLLINISVVNPSEDIVILFTKSKYVKCSNGYSTI